MCAPISNDISKIVSDIHSQLESLQNKIGDQVSNVNDQEIGQVVAMLKTRVHRFLSRIHKGSTIALVGEDLKKSLLTLIDSIEKTATFSQAVGAYQPQLMSLFKTIRTNFPEAERKVTKVETDPTRR